MPPIAGQVLHSYNIDLPKEDTAAPRSVQFVYHLYRSCKWMAQLNDANMIFQAAKPISLVHLCAYMCWYWINP